MEISISNGVLFVLGGAKFASHTRGKDGRSVSAQRAMKKMKAKCPGSEDIEEYHTTRSDNECFLKTKMFDVKKPRLNDSEENEMDKLVDEAMESASTLLDLEIDLILFNEVNYKMQSSLMSPNRLR